MGADATYWQGRLDALAPRFRVPGASLAVATGDDVITAATGVLNVTTGHRTTPDSMFQIGSIAKSYTAVLIMQLVAEGAVDIDAPISKALPELRLADDEAVDRITMRHLLTHSSGIDGDHLEDTGRGDDVLERYVASCASLPLSHPVGATMSYCNTGFVLAGRVVEKLTGRTWDDALRTRLLAPLGLTNTVTLPEEQLRYALAHGHLVEPGRPPRLAPISMLPRALGPAGLISSTALETLAFGRMCLAGGTAPDGTRILPAELLREMVTPQVEVPNPWTLLTTHWGLGFGVSTWDGCRVYGHDGDTIGQSAALRMVPDAGVAIALLTNGGNAHDLIEQLLRELCTELCDVELPSRPTPPDPPITVDTTRYVGRYEREGSRLELSERDGALECLITPTGPLANLSDKKPEPLTLIPVDDRLFLTRVGDQANWTPVVCYRLADGTRYVHLGARATPMVTEAVT